jgi:hypothetical protein
MEHDYKMFLHLRTLGTTRPKNWDTLGKVHTTHHAEKLRIIRYNASSRAQLIMQNYMYLRDARERDFSSNSLTGAITTALQEQLYELEAALEAPTKNGVTNPQWPCAHCHSDIHEGGQPRCVLKDLPLRKARQVGKELHKQILAAPDRREEIIAEVLKRELGK